MSTSQFIDLRDPVIFQSFGGEEYWSKETFAKGEIILQEGEGSQDFYYLFSGLVKVTKSLKDAAKTQKALVTLGDGDFFGEGSLLSSKTRGATVQALTDVVLVKLPRFEFERLVVEDSQAAVGIILGIVQVMNARLQDMDERLVTLHRIAQLTREHGHNPSDILPLVLSDMSALTHHAQIALFSADAQLKFSTPAVDQTLLDKMNLALPEALKAYQVNPENYSFVAPEAAYLVLGKGANVYGILAFATCAKCQEVDLRFLFLVSQELEHLLGAKTN